MALLIGSFVFSNFDLKTSRIRNVFKITGYNECPMSCVLLEELPANDVFEHHTKAGT